MVNSHFEGEERVLGRLKKMADRGENLSQPLNAIGEIVLSSIDQNFLSGGRFESADSFRGGSNRWQDLAESTKKQRRKQGTWPGQILQRSQGGLANAMTKEVNGNTLAIGNSKIYARIQQKGGKTGRNHATTIPGRPYLVVQEEDAEDMLDVLDNHIMKE